MSANTTSLQWAGGGGNVLAQRFPSFQFDPEDVLSGRVKVFARSPSGRVQPMDVLDADGLFNANFTPDEVGTCTAVMCRPSSATDSRYALSYGNAQHRVRLLRFV